MTTASDLWVGFSSLGTPASTISSEGILTLTSSSLTPQTASRYRRTVEAIGGSVGYISFEAKAVSGQATAFAEFNGAYRYAGGCVIDSPTWRKYRFPVICHPTPDVGTFTWGFESRDMDGVGQIQVRKPMLYLPGAILPTAAGGGTTQPSALVSGTYKAILTTGGRLLLGSEESIDDGSAGRRFQIHGLSSSGTNISIFRWDAGGGPLLSLIRSRSGVVGEHAAVLPGDDIGVLQCKADNGTAFTLAAQFGATARVIEPDKPVQSSAYIDNEQNIGRIRSFETDELGNTILGSRRVRASSDTTAFLYVPMASGAPTGVPAKSVSGFCPMYVDSTNMRLYFFIAGSWKSSALT